MYISDRRIYLTADRSKAVEEGDPSASMLLVAEGSQISEADAEKYGLSFPSAPEPLNAVDQAKYDLDQALARGGEEEARIHAARLIAATEAAGADKAPEAKAQPAPPENKARKSAPENKGA